MVYTDKTKQAMELCLRAHGKQKDKSGVPYVFHPIHVAEQMEDEDSTIVALLHDVVEDTDITLEELREQGYSEEVLEALALMTHEAGVPYFDYIRRIRTDPLATKVKLADLAHNSDLSRLDHTPTEKDIQRWEKYQKSRQILLDGKLPQVDKVSIITTPTPLTRLERISADMGIDLWLKRDDLTDFGTGGNKLRKLEYFLKDALDQGATMLLTVGGAQTNHGRLTAAVAARYGLKSAIVAVDEYPGELSANLLLDAIMDCHVYLVEPVPGQKDGVLLKETVASVTEEWEQKGEHVYYIPMGGSNELGALGYYDCAMELAKQIQEESFAQPRIVTTVGSMGTYVGLAAAIANEPLPMRLTGIGVLPYRDIRQSCADYYERVREAYDLPVKLAAEDLDVTSKYDYGGYNNPVEDVRRSIYYMGSKEGIILDPCYTGKTFNAIRRMVAEGKIRKGETVIMLHTGGVPGIYTRHHRVEMEEELKGNVHIL